MEAAPAQRPHDGAAHCGGLTAHWNRWSRLPRNGRKGFVLHMSVDDRSHIEVARGLSEVVDAFSDEISQRLDAYVYRLEDPRDGTTFYIGKGRGNRVFQHQRMAAGGDPGLRYDRIREIRAAGLEPRIRIHRHGMTDETAHEVEAALIDAYATEQLTNLVSGHGIDRGVMGVLDVSAAYGAQPAEIHVPAILIKIERQWDPSLTAEQLYERTRRYWVCRPERHPVPDPRAVRSARDCSGGLRDRLLGGVSRHAPGDDGPDPAHGLRPQIGSY